MTATIRGLQRIHPEVLAYPLDVIAQRAADGDFDLHPAYQRGSVWGLTRKRNLIRSLIQRLPIGAIFLNKRHIMENNRVVDGKQRIEAILDFVAGRMCVPGEWFAAEDLRADALAQAEFVYFADLTLTAQRRFGHAIVQVYQTHLPTEVEERELFDLINFGGVPQGEADDDAPEGR